LPVEAILNWADTHPKPLLIVDEATLAFIPVPSQAQFFLIPVENCALFKESLLPHGIMVRDCASFGLPDTIRISPRTRNENLRLFAVLKKVLGK
jgi:histidinol-phosphate aminotransferase